MSTDLPKLGSLSQAAREKQLNVARGILLLIGFLTVGANVFSYATIEKQVEDEINKQVGDLRARGMVPNPGEVEKFRRTVVPIARMIAAAMIAVGGLFIVFGAIVKKFPVPITIISLVIYVGAAAVFAFLDPATLAAGLIIKIIIVVALAKSIQSAIAYERELKKDETEATFGGPMSPQGFA